MQILRAPTCSLAQSLLNQISFLAHATPLFVGRYKSHEIEYFSEMNLPRAPTLATPPFKAQSNVQILNGNAIPHT